MSSPNNKRKAEDEAPTPPTKQVRTAPPAAAIATDEDPDWDDDKPICDLMVVYMKKRQARQIQKQREEAEREANKKAPRQRSSESSGAPRISAPTRPDALYYETQKGSLVQKLLVRWWHAYSWPQQGDWNVDDVPSGYEELDGFPGVFVSMNVTTLGKILDLRNNDMKPSLLRMSKKTASEVKELCITAYENQIKELAQSEGNTDSTGNGDSSYMHELKRELHGVKKIDTDAAEREAKNFVF